MLHLKTHTSFHLPSLLQPSHQMTLSPVLDEPDELIQEIDNQALVHDDAWTLSPAPDNEQLTKFWRGVEDDIAKDPEWQRFDNAD